MSEKADIDQQDMSDNESSNSSSSSSSGIPPFKKPYVERRSVEKWLQDPKLSTWLRKHEDGRPWCGVCEIHFKINFCKNTLIKHANSYRHKINMQQNIEVAGTSSDLVDAKNETKILETRYCLFAIEHNVSFETLQALNKFNKSIIGSKLPSLKSITLGRTKIRAIIKNVINRSIALDIQKVVQEKYFSLIIDESTDVSNTKHLSILIRFVNNNQLETQLLDLISVKDATADNIFKCMVNSLNKFNLSNSKVIGIGVDNASMMLGRSNSVMSRFKESNSEIVTFACLCHSMHLVAVHATKCIPDFIDKVLQDIYKYCSHSPKRAELLHDIQKLMQLEKQKVLRPSKTMWLAQVNCIAKILDQWDSLFKLFAVEQIDDNLSTDSIYSRLTNNFTKPYLQFLHYILKHFHKFNILFQSHEILIHKISEECKSFIRVLATHFIKQEFLIDDNFEILNAYDSNVLLPLENIFIGGEATQLINNLKESQPELDNQITDFYKIVQKFYQISFVECIKRLPYNDHFVEALNFLDPKVALHYKKHVGQIEIIIQKFPSKVIGTKVIDQWFLLAAKPSADEKEKLETLNVIQFWNTVSNLKDALGNLLYDEVAKLAFICLSLPHSNADVLRYFSTIKDIKNKKRNKLSTLMVCALTRIKLYLQSKHIDACSFEISDQMLECFNMKMYNRDEIPSDLNGILLADETEASSSDSDIC